MVFAVVGLAVMGLEVTGDKSTVVVSTGDTRDVVDVVTIASVEVDMVEVDGENSSVGSRILGGFVVTWAISGETVSVV